MFRKAQEWGKALANPVAQHKPLRVNNRRLRFLSLEEIDRLLTIADARLRPILITALHRGLRRGELLRLTWPDLDFKLGLLRVVDTKNGERREIPMSDTLRTTLRQIPRALETDYVFQERRATPWWTSGDASGGRCATPTLRGWCSMICAIPLPRTW
jgi:integrase